MLWLPPQQPHQKRSNNEEVHVACYEPRLEHTLKQIIIALLKVQYNQNTNYFVGVNVIIDKQQIGPPACPTSLPFNADFLFPQRSRAEFCQKGAVES